MKKTRMALKPYLDKITEHCRTLSKKELTDVIISLAKDATTSSRVQFLKKIGKSRIEHIVSNKYRRAYARAAQVLGSLAEAYTAMEQKNKAVKILHKYYNEKYNRFSAFRREVKAVVKDSDLLKNLGFLK